MKNTIKSKVIKTLCLGFLLGMSVNGIAQSTPPGTEKLIPYGDFNSWLVRIIDESFVIGGNTKVLYEVAPVDTIRGTSLTTFARWSPCVPPT